MKFLISILLFMFSVSFSDPYADDKLELKRQYDFARQAPTDIYEHVPVLCSLSRECSTVVEIGLRTMVSTWGLLQGLSENPAPSRSYLGIDLNSPPRATLEHAKYLAESNGIDFDFWQANDKDITIEATELLFIDTLHTYCHLTYELEKFSPVVTKYIAMHDTSAPWGELDDNQYEGDYSEYPAEYDRTKRGLWAAVEDFLKRHPEWVLHERRLNNHGFTILKRIGDQ